MYICYKLWLCCPSQLDGVQVKYDMFLAAFNPTTLLCLRRLGPILLPYHCKTTAKLFIIDERFQQQSPSPMFPVIIGFVVRCSVATRKPECKDIQALAILFKSVSQQETVSPVYRSLLVPHGPQTGSNCPLLSWLQWPRSWPLLR